MCWLSITNWQSIKSKSKWLSIFVAGIESRIDYIKCQSVVCWQEQAPIIDFKYWRTKYYTYAFEETECVLIFSTIVVIMQSVAQKKTHQNKYSQEKKQQNTRSDRKKSTNMYTQKHHEEEEFLHLCNSWARDNIFLFNLQNWREKTTTFILSIFVASHLILATVDSA